MRLDLFRKHDYTPGRPLWVQLLWYLFGHALVASRLVPSSAIKRSVLRLFGSRIGRGVVIKPGVKVKLPWRLSIGDYSWIGEDVWIDNLADVTIGEHVCVSQGTFLCTGSHDWGSEHFDLITKPITLESHSWIGAKSAIAPNSYISTGAVVTLGSVARGKLNPWWVYTGNPATPQRERPRSSDLLPKQESVLFVNQTFWPDCSASAQFLTDAALYFVERGVDVHVLSMRGSYTDEAQFASKELYRGISVRRCWSPLRGRRSRIGRLLSSIIGNFALVLAAARAPRCDRIVALTSPPLLCVFLRLIAWLKGSRFVAWVFDLNPDQAAAAGWISPNSVVYALLDRAVTNALDAASSVVVLDKYMASRLEEKKITPSRIHTVPLWLDSTELAPIPHSENSFRKEHFSDDTFIVLFAGNLSLCHPIETILRAAAVLRSDPSIHFVFSGGGARLAEVRSYISQEALTNVTLLPYRPREDLPELLAAGDLHLVPMGEKYVGIVHPSKIYGILSVGRPFVFVGPKNSFIVDELVSKGVGTHVDHGESDRLVEVIRLEQRKSSSERVINQAEMCRFAERFEKDTVLSSLFDRLQQ